MGFITNPDNSKKQVAEGITFNTKQKSAQMWPLDPMVCSTETVAAGDGSGSPTALSITTAVSFVTTATNSTHVSLGDGTSIGHCKFIVHKTRNTTSTLTNNYSLDFDGLDDSIDLGDTFKTWTESATKTLSVWILNGGNTSETRVFNVGYLTSSGNTAFGFGLDGGTTDNKPFYFLRDTGGSALKAEFGDVCDTENWYHFAIVQDGSADEAYMYQNGDLKATVSSVGEISVASPDTAKIGRKFNSAHNFFNGQIDELGMWDVALDADAVSAIYNSGSPIDLTEASGDYDNEGDLIGWWRMGDGTEAGSGNTIYDMSANSVNGTKSGAGGSNNTPQYLTTAPQGNSADLVITPDNFAGGSTLTSNSAARTIMLIWDGSNWQALGEITGTAEFVIA